MNILTFDLTAETIPFKPMNAVNNGPIHNWKRPRFSNLQSYKEAKIPYARTHDASFCANYGGEHTVDITAVFPDFDADPYSPDSYDFVCTDHYLRTIEAAGTGIFYRLGQKIEWGPKKYGTVPPKDFHKWAVICEHVIRHLTEGWADGHCYNIEYWEIWNEADGSEPYPVQDRPTWGGSREEFFDFYEIAAKHLKGCFPHLKIGGPSLSGNFQWAEHFLTEMKKRSVPLDFFSWHSYLYQPEELKRRIFLVDDLLKKTGFADTESINDEWNYNKGWLDPEFTDNFRVLTSMKGAAFAMACMIVGQQSPLDMLMYYDARPSTYNGIFDFYTLEPLKTYYAIKWYSSFCQTNGEIRTEDRADDIYTLCGRDASGKVQALVTYYTDEENMPDKELRLDFGREGKYQLYLLDESHNAEPVFATDHPQFTIKPNTCILVAEI